MRFWIKTWLVLLAVAGLMAGTGAIVWRLARERYAPPAAVQVRVEAAGPGTLAESISATGVILPRKTVKISAKVSARIMALPVAEGDVVRAARADATPPEPGSVLVRLDDRDLRSRLRAAQASRDAMAAQVEVDEAALASQRSELSAEEIRLEQLERDRRRKADLLATQDIAQAAYDEIESACREGVQHLEAGRHRLTAAEAGLRVLRHRIEAADADIEQAKEALSYTTITAPIDGTVISLNAQVGEMVVTGTMNNAGTVIMEVADLAAMIVVAEVDEADVGKVAVGQPAVIHVQAYPDATITGTVETIALMHRLSNRGTRYFRTEIRIERPDVPLYSGLTANVDIRTQVHSDVLTVPSQAVLGRKVEDLPASLRGEGADPEGDKTYAMVVYRVVGGRTVVTPVRIGAADMSRTVIAGGLSAGDQVVVGPYKVLDGLTHDREVIVLAADAAADAGAVSPSTGGAGSGSRARGVLRHVRR
ncbi:MAG: efflux RND transporter periplasmic adaptor subunit [Lentisphaerae bacterium]|nr:efflux RND transporter periplasmic adaptor subunit [Lentisphaerota bacterium]